MTNTEYITEFSMWALLNSPLIVATDPRYFSPFPPLPTTLSHLARTLTLSYLYLGAVTLTSSRGVSY